MCTLDGRVSRAKLRADVEGGRAAAADDDVVCVGVVFAASVCVVASGSCNPPPPQFSVVFAFGTSLHAIFGFVCILTL
jgi:hypothetical protein